MTHDLVIKDGRVITATASFQADVAVNGEQIAAVGLGLRGEQEIDAGGLYVLPGAIDGHVHLTDHNSASVLTADSFATGSRAAAFGGVTTLVDFAESQDGRSLLESLERRQEDADGHTVIDYALHLNLRDEDPARLTEIPDVMTRGVPSIKLFMAYEGYRLHDPALFRALQLVAANDGMAVIHAENDDMIHVLQEQLAADGKRGPRWHTTACPPVTESEAIHRVLLMARLAGTRTLIYHVSSKQGLSEIAHAKRRGQIVYGEACVQYLVLTDEEYQEDDWYAHSLMIRPPIRSRSHQTAIWKGLAMGHLDIVSTDHNPRPRLAERPLQPPGIAGIETRLALIHHYGVGSGSLSLERWVKVCCTQPARVFGLARKGQLAPGYDADIVLFDPQKAMTFSAQTLHSAVDYSSYQGMSVTGFPVTTICRGQILVRDGEFVGPAGYGRFVFRDRYH